MSVYFKKCIISLTLFLLCSMLIFGSDKKEEFENKYEGMSYDNLLHTGISLVDEMLKTGVDKVDEALYVFELVLKISPTPENNAWYGCVWAMKADKDSNVINKVNYVLKGCEYIDKAINDEPNNVLIRRIRIETYSFFPEDIFKKGEVVEDDLKYLMKLHKTNPELFNKNTYDSAWSFYTYGQLLIKKGKLTTGKRYLNTAMKITKDKELLDKILYALGEKGEE